MSLTKSVCQLFDFAVVMTTPIVCARGMIAIPHPRVHGPWMLCLWGPGPAVQSYFGNLKTARSFGSSSFRPQCNSPAVAAIVAACVGTLFVMENNWSMAFCGLVLKLVRSVAPLAWRYGHEWRGTQEATQNGGASGVNGTGRDARPIVT